MLDIHSHILPGLDDGAPDMETALAMARIAVSDGITRMVATPHYLEGSMDNSRHWIIETVYQFKQELKNERINLEIVPGCEVYLSPNTPALLKKGELMTVNDGGKYLLVEFPMHNIPNYAEEILFELKVMGVTPIIVHPERNLELGKNPEQILKLVMKGCLLQINSGSINGLYGTNVTKTAHLLVKNDLVHLLGSDAHSAGVRSPKIREAVDWIERVKPGRAKQIMSNGMKVFTGEQVNPDFPRQLKSHRAGLWEKIKSII